MTELQNANPIASPQAEENPDRLDEQHIHTTATLGFLIHPNIGPIPSISKIADIGTGTGIWLLDVAKTLPPACQLTGFDVSASAFPRSESLPQNISFRIQDFTLPFPASDIGTYNIVAVRFVSVATPREEWARSIRNLVTLLKPGGWLQWIDSCNFRLYNSVPGTSRAACMEIYDGLDSWRTGEDVVIGMMMREAGNLGREDVFRQCGLVGVHEDVFSTDRLQDPGLRLREKGTRNALDCFTQCLESLIQVEGSGWSLERLERVRREAAKEVDEGAYHLLDHVCIVGRKP